MTDPQVPRMPDLMAAAVDAVCAGLDDRARAQRIFHANHGRWGDVLRGFRGQAERTRARMTREIIATRLIEQNTGQPLKDLAASEYFARLPDEPQYAVGEVLLTRTKQNSSSGMTGNFLAGTVKSGLRVNRPQVVGGDLPLSDAQYTFTEDVVCSTDDTFSPTDLGDGKWLHTQQVSVPIKASRSGVGPNTPILAGGELADRLFDASLPIADRFVAGSLSAAGGAVGGTDPQVLALAKAMGTGRHGANNAAALAGALSDPRVRRVAAKLDYSTAILRLFIADASWATSAKLRSSVLQGLADNKWIGFGARVAMGRIFQQPVTVEGTVLVRSALSKADHSELTAVATGALLHYFDERPDFYTWQLNAIGGVIAQADKRILTCQSPVVRQEGVAATEPARVIAGGAEAIPHYLLTGVSFNFVSPGQ